MKISTLSIAAILTLLSVVQVGAQIPAKKNATGFIVREDHCNPKSDEASHGSSICQLPNGDLLACWFFGTGERRANHVKIMGARLKKGSSQWSEPFEMADTPNIPDCNPTLTLTQSGKLVLTWIAVLANEWNYSLLRYRTATDLSGNGAPKWSWQDDILLKTGDEFPQEVQRQFREMGRTPNGWCAYAPRYDDQIMEASQDIFKRNIGWMTRIKGTVLPSGRILLPLYSDGYNFSVMAISDDDAQSWRLSKPIVGRGNIQPALALRKNGEIVSLMRTAGDPPERVWRSVSKDHGETWSIPTATDIPNTGSVELLALKDGRFVFVGNDVADGRYRLAIYLSDDEGETFRPADYIEFEQDKSTRYSYPSLIQTTDGLLHLTYTDDQEGHAIKHVVMDPSKLH